MSQSNEIAKMMEFYPDFENYIEKVVIVYRRLLPRPEPAPYPFEDTDYRNPLRSR